MSRKKSHNQEAFNAEQAKIAMEESKKLNEKLNDYHLKKNVDKELKMTTSIDMNNRPQTWPDFVCGKNVADLANTYTYKETVYVFCSQECKEKFAKHPKDFT